VCCTALTPWHKDSSGSMCCTFLDDVQFTKRQVWTYVYAQCTVHSAFGGWRLVVTGALAVPVGAWPAHFTQLAMSYCSMPQGHCGHAFLHVLQTGMAPLSGCRTRRSPCAFKTRSCRTTGRFKPGVCSSLDDRNAGNATQHDLSAVNTMRNLLSLQQRHA
jgi:hypothetical protein